MNTLLDINSQYQVDGSDKVLAVSALSFDLSVYDLFGLLAAGGEVVFPHDELAMDPRHWLEMIEQHQVSIWDTVPASAGLLVEQLELQNRQSSAPIANVMMSGDWIDPGLPKRLRQVFADADIYSLGGATEGSIWSIHYPIKTDTCGLKSVPYGKPLSNQRFYIVDNQLNLSPVGAIGELCIGGIGVARCYYGAPELTERQFIYHQGLEQKLYRTGDLGRYMPDGNIEFMGRLDHQVKIRGFRIEIGEIEQNLKNCDNVGSALVVAKKDDLDNQYLVAYVLPEDRQLIGAEQEFGTQLKAALKAHLLEYMIPDYFIVMERWPLTANGKVDVKSLPLPDFSANQRDYVAPRTDTEKTLVGIWAQLLEQEEATIGINSNFADIGGHSILIVRMVMLIQEAFDVKLAIRDIYIQNTIELLAVLIDEQLANELMEQQKVELNKKMAEKLENMNDDVEEFSL